jgi:DnaJ-class molecular chaperone
MFILVEVPSKLNSEQIELLKKFSEISGQSYPEAQGFINKMKDWFH